MSFAEKHNSITAQFYPTYSVQYKNASEMTDGNKYPVTWAGAYDSQYGREAYIDITDDAGDHIRVKVPKWMNKEIESISRDADDMKDIQAGKVLVKFETFETKKGYNSTRAVWSDRVPAPKIDDSKLPF